MRSRLQYGVPAAAGLAAGGYALSQGEDPGSAALAGIGGTLGGAAGLLGARALAGKYSQKLPNLVSEGLDKPVGKSNQSIRERLQQGITSSPEYMRRGEAATTYSPQTTGNRARVALLGLPGVLESSAAQGIAAGLVPGSAALAGLGGAGLGAGLEAMGMPGFQQQAPMDPEEPGSSNTTGARNMRPTMQYI